MSAWCSIRGRRRGLVWHVFWSHPFSAYEAEVAQRRRIDRENTGGLCPCGSQPCDPVWHDRCHPEDYCHRCGGPNFPWWVPSPVWNAVMGYPDQAHDGIVCPCCFAELAEAKGAKGPWRVAPREWPEGVSLVHVDGRVWDATTERWVDEEAGR